MTTRASKQPKTGPEIWDLDGDGRRYALSVDGLIRFTGSREDCENRLRLLAPASTRDAQNWHLGRALGALVLAALATFAVPRGTEAASTINTTLPVQGQPYNAAPIRQNFGAAANDISSLQQMNAGASAPSAPVLGTLWLETPVGETNYNLRIWNSRLNAWVQIATLDSENGLWITNVGGGLPVSLLADDTTDLGSVPNTVIEITGAGPIYSFGATAPPGTIKVLVFSGATEIVYNATSMILPGAANVTTGARDIAIVTVLEAGNWLALTLQEEARIVQRGGTGRTSLTDHAVLVGAGTAAVNFAVPGTLGYPLLSTGASADPAFGQLDLAGAGTIGSLLVARGGTGLATITAHSLMIGNGTSAPTLLTPGTATLPLISLGPTLDPAYQLLPVSGGGTGTNFLTQHNVLIGNGAGGLAFAAPGTSGYPLLSTGAAANPAFGQLNLAGGTVTGVLPLANLPFTIPTASLLGGTGSSFVGIAVDATLALPATTLGVNPNLSLSTLAVAGTSTLQAVTATNLGASGNVSVGATLSLDSQFYMQIVGDTPLIAFDANRYIGYDRGSGVMALSAGVLSSINLGSTGVVAITGDITASGTLHNIGVGQFDGNLGVSGHFATAGTVTAGDDFTAHGATTTLTAPAIVLSFIPISGGGKETLCYDTGTKEISYSNAGVC